MNNSPKPSDSAAAPEVRRPALDRREFVRAALLVGAGAAASVGVVVKDRRAAAPRDPTGPGTVRHFDHLAEVPATEHEDVLLRMKRELQTAMAKPVEQRKWVMVIDRRKCVGCHACTIGCIAENKLPPGVVYRPVMTEESGEFPNVKQQFTPRPCMQCEEPPCVAVCPVNATWRRPDGITIVNYDQCIGCRYCLTACPYGARTSDFGEHYTAGAAVGSAAGPDATVAGTTANGWEQQPSHELGKSWDRDAHGLPGTHASPMGNARKCHFCLHRLEAGMLPMCATTCIGRATYFGDANDPRSLVTELITKHHVETLLPHKGTKPRVFYIS